MTTYFISDLHLDELAPHISQVFLYFLQTKVTQADALYILGDLFEVWIGDDIENEFVTSITRALQQLSAKGVPIYLLTGNRDFLIGKRFAQQSGCQLIKQPQLINLYGTPTLILHGDSLCTADKKYQRQRKIAMHPITKKLFLLTPRTFRQKIAQKLRNKSKKYKSTASLMIMDVTQKAVNQLMRKHKVQHLIHGHTHRPAIHAFTLDDKPAQRTVLGAWHELGHALAVQSDGSYELITFKTP